MYFFIISLYFLFKKKHTKKYQNIQKRQVLTTKEENNTKALYRDQLKEG